MGHPILSRLSGLITAITMSALAPITWAGDRADDLSPPIQLAVEGQPIDTEVGHAAPFVGDFDGDGVDDLLVGQFGGGKLRIYRNTAANGQPQYAALEWFKADDDYGTVPAS